MFFGEMWRSILRCNCSYGISVPGKRKFADDGKEA